jgi:hypothetical protein
MKVMKSLKEYISEAQVNESFLTVGAGIIIALTLAKYALTAVGIGKAAVKATKHVKEIKRKHELSLHNKEYAKAINDLELLVNPYKHKLMETEYGKLIYSNNFIDLMINGNIDFAKIEEDIKSVLSESELKEYYKIVNILEKYTSL